MAMPFPASPQPTYSALQGSWTSRADRRLFSERRALLLGVTVLLALLCCLVALPRAPTGAARARPSSALTLDGKGGAKLLGNGSLALRAEASQGALQSSADSGHLEAAGAANGSLVGGLAFRETNGSSLGGKDSDGAVPGSAPAEFDGEVAGLGEALQEATAGATTPAATTTPAERSPPKKTRREENELESTSPKWVESRGSTSTSSAAAPPQTKAQKRRSEREERRSARRDSLRRTGGNASSEEANATQGPRAGSAAERREANKELRYIFGEASAVAAAVCAENHTAYVPLDMRRHAMSYEDSAEACQRRCAAIDGCKTFTFFWADKSCHVQDENTIRLYSPGSQTGKPTCNIFRKL